MVALLRWLLPVSLLAALAAQDPSGERAKVSGMVRDAARKPIAGATVHLLARPIPRDERIGLADRLRVPSDEQGRFRAQILTGRVYTAWAESGGAVSAPVEDVFPNVPVVLDLDPAGTAFELRLQGLERWRAKAPFRCRIVTTTQNVELVEVAIDAKGTGTVPALPGAGITVELRSCDDFPLLQQTSPRPAAGEALALEVPAPTPTLFGVADLGTGMGLAGVRISQQLRDRLVPIATTEADGCVQVDLAITGGRNWPPNHGFLAEVEGHGIATFMNVATRGGGGVLGGGNAKVPELRPGVPLQLFARLDRGTTDRGRVLLRDGEPARRLALLVQGSGMHFQGAGARYLSTYDRVVWTDDDGRYEIPGTFADSPPIVRAVLGDEHMARLPKTWRRGLLPFVPLLAPRGQGADHGDTLLTDLHPLCLQLLDSEGLPANHASVEFYAFGGRRQDSVERRATTWHTNHTGEVRVLLPPGDDVAVFATRGSDLLLGQLSVPARDVDLCTLRLLRGWWIAGCLKGGGAVGWKPSPNNSPGAAASDTWAGSGLLPIADAQWLQSFFFERWFGHEQPWPTGDGGSFRIPVLPMPMRYRVGGVEVVLNDGPVEDLVVQSAWRPR
ncbi:MAG TPA: hypothetical protein VFZ65_05645 [Planctomycetota bacterium]|nr:hypothetical protein [Planctomycetota bacterium]